MPNHAEDLAKVTGATRVTYTQERRNADGTLTVESVETYERPAEQQAKIVILLAAHQPKPARGVGRGGKPGLLVECEGCEFETFIADMPFSDTRADLRLDFARHQAKILREHANVTEK